MGLTASPIVNLADVAAVGGTTQIFPIFSEVDGTAPALAQQLFLSFGSGTRFELARTTPFYAPPAQEILRDPSLIYWQGFYYVAYTTSFTATGHFGIAKSPDLVRWTWVCDVDTSDVAGTHTTWAPEFYVEGSNVYVLFYTDGGTGLHYKQATASDLSTWGASGQITGPAAAAINEIDGFIYKSGSTYYLFSYESGTWYRTSTSMFSGYSARTAVQVDGVNIVGEGPSVHPIPGTPSFELFWDNQVSGSGHYIRRATGPSPIGPWVFDGDVLFNGVNASWGHGTPLRVPTAFAAALAGLRSQPRIRLVYRTANSTARVSTTTFADDDVLVMNGLAPGFYRVKAFLHFINESTAPGAKVKFAFTGSATSRGGPVSYNDTAELVRIIGSPDNFNTYETDGLSLGGAIAPVFTMDFVLEVGVAGNLKLQWAQQSSSADDAIMWKGSRFTVEPLFVE